MITYVYGTDKYRIKEYLSEHAQRALVGEEALKSRGLFEQTPVILYDPPASLKIPDSPEISVFVVSEKKPRHGKNIIGFNLLKGQEIRAWIQEELQKQNLAIAPDALAVLADRYIDTWQTKLELDKVCSYAHWKKVIEVSDIHAVSSIVLRDSVFRLTDAIANRKKRDALLLLDSQLASGADPYYLFSMIVYQFRNMLAPGRPGVHPFAAGKARLAARQFDAAALAARYRDLYNLEHDAKTGKRDITNGLYQFIFSL